MPEAAITGSHSPDPNSDKSIPSTLGPEDGFREMSALTSTDGLGTLSTPAASAEKPGSDPISQLKSTLRGQVKKIGELEEQIRFLNEVNKRAERERAELLKMMAPLRGAESRAQNYKAAFDMEVQNNRDRVEELARLKSLSESAIETSKKICKGLYEILQKTGKAEKIRDIEKLPFEHLCKYAIQLLEQVATSVQEYCERRKIKQSDLDNVQAAYEGAEVRREAAESEARRVQTALEELQASSAARIAELEQRNLGLMAEFEAFKKMCEEKKSLESAINPNERQATKIAALLERYLDADPRMLLKIVEQLNPNSEIEKSHALALLTLKSPAKTLNSAYAHAEKGEAALSERARTEKSAATQLSQLHDAKSKFVAWLCGAIEILEAHFLIKELEPNLKKAVTDSMSMEALGRVMLGALTDPGLIFILADTRASTAAESFRPPVRASLASLLGDEKKIVHFLFSGSAMKAAATSIRKNNIDAAEPVVKELVKALNCWEEGVALKAKLASPEGEEIIRKAVYFNPEALQLFL